jgi:alpha-L-rhamnosidase
MPMSLKNIRTIVLAFLFFTFPPAFTQSQSAAVFWKANWIWQEDDGPVNTWMCFRKTFDLNALGKIAIVHLAVDSKYWLYVNDTLVVFEGGLNRGPTPSAGYYDSINIQPYLELGKNTISVLVWYWGNEGRNNLDSGKGGLLLQTDLPEFTLISDRSWKIKTHPAYTLVPFKPNIEGTYYLYGGWNIGFDARKNIPDWFRRTYNDSSWNNATEKGMPPCAPWNELWPRPIPQWKNSGLENYSNAASLPNLSDGRPITAKLPYNAQVTPYFKIAAPAGLCIKMQTDHYEVNGFCGQRTEYITTNGIQEFEALAWQNGEKVVYDIPAGIKILAVKYRETGYAAELAGSFTCDDDFYNLLIQKAARTLYVCIRDNYMDCPDRERGQWIGDVAAEVPQTFYALDRNIDYLTRTCIREFIDWRDGSILQGLVPGANPGELASQSLNAISDIGIIMTYYRNTGDLTPIWHAYDAIKAYLDVWTLNQDGTINSRAWWNGQGHFIDHDLLENTWYYMALHSAKTMAELTDHADDAIVFQKKMDTMASHFEQNFWHGDAYRSSPIMDDRANGLVVLSGLAGPEKWASLASVLTRIKNAEPYMEGYVLEALFKMGYAEQALNRMKERYTSMVQANSSTLWEMFTSDGTLNHAWAGAPLTSLFRYVAGITPVTPGYGTYHVMPQLGQLKKVSAVVPSIKGKISVAINRDESHYAINVHSPDSTVAIVGIPKKAFSSGSINAIEANNTVIWKKGGYTGGRAGINWYNEDDTYYKFMLMPGSYSITAWLAPLSVTMDVPSSSRLFADNFPNPFNAHTMIKIKVPQPERITVAIYDVCGSKVCQLMDEEVATTESQLLWHGTNSQGVPVSTGLYFCRIISGRQQLIMKMLLTR